MPLLTSAVPKYRFHRASGQAIVTICGRDRYLGPHGTKASKLEYDRLIAEWLAAGRRDVAAPTSVLTIVEIVALYWPWAKQHYRKNGEPTNELNNIRHALRPMLRLYGHCAITEFGPKSLKALQQDMIRCGLCRNVINSRIGKIKRVMRWAVSEQLAPKDLMPSLDSVQGLQCGRTEARETMHVKPVDDAVVDATLPYMPPVIADMVRIQRFTGARPTEVCLLRPCDVDRSQRVWAFCPSSHKTEHHDRERVIFLGPRAQAILQPYLDRDPEAYCFSPAESEATRKKELRARRKTKVQPCQRDRSKPGAARRPRERYTRQSYLYAVRRACEKAFPMPAELDKAAVKQWRQEHWWSPNRLRHTAGTTLRKQFGIEAAQLALGHSRPDVTLVYAERDLAKAAAVMGKVG